MNRNPTVVSKTSSKVWMCSGERVAALLRLLWGSSYPARKVPRLEEQPARSLD